MHCNRNNSATGRHLEHIEITMEMGAKRIITIILIWSSQWTFRRKISWKSSIFYSWLSKNRWFKLTWIFRIISRWRNLTILVKLNTEVVNLTHHIMIIVKIKHLILSKSRHVGIVGVFLFTILFQSVSYVGSDCSLKVIHNQYVDSPKWTFPTTIYSYVEDFFLIQKLVHQGIIYLYGLN
jgi:hypothetical protein